MSTTDNRIVRMVFDNAAFKRAAAETKSALDKVNAAVTKAGQSKGLLNLNKDMKEVAINASKMQVATAAAIGTIASKATAAGLGLAKSLLINPIKDGFNEYGELLTKQNAIMNSTGKSADVVKKTLNDLNTYSDKTIFKFSDMTQALTKFTNAGIPLKKSAETIKGVGNAAAFAGLTSEKAGAAFYAIAQVMETGFLQGNDLMQLNNAGFATTKFKDEVVKAAVSLGTLRKSGDHYVTKTGKYVSATKGFKDNLKEQWASAEAVNIALQKYNDNSTKFGRKAFASATQVRTFSAFMGTLRESLGSGWAQVFSAMFGGLEEATSMWTTLSLAIGGVVSKFFSFLSSSIQIWRDMGGAAKIGQTLKNVLSPLGALFGAIGKAWHAAFGQSGGKGMGSTLYGVSVALELLTRPLTWLAWLISQLVHPLTIFFLAIKIGGLIIGRAIGFVVDFVKSIFDLASFKMPSGSGGGTIIGWFKTVIKEVERAIWVFKSLLEEGASIKDAFKSLGDIDLKFPPFPKLPELPDWMKGLLPDTVNLPGIGGFKVPKIGSIFGGGGGGQEASQIQTVSTAVMDLASHATDLDYVMQGLSENSILGGSGKPGGIFSAANIKELEGSLTNLTGVNIRELESGIGDAFEGFGVNVRELEQGTEIFADSMANARDTGQGFMDVLKNIVGAVGDFFGIIKGEDVVKSLNWALLATGGLTAFKMFKSFSDLAKSWSKIGAGFGETLSGAGDALKSFQTRAKAELIKQIGIALLLLAGALLILSLIPREKMITALIGLSVALAAVSATLFAMDKYLKNMSTAKLAALGFAFAGIGLGLMAIAAALVIFNYVDNDSIARAGIVLGILFIGLEKIGKLAQKSGRKLVAAAVAIGIIGVSLGILAVSLLLFKLVDNDSLAKGAGVIIVLTAALLALGLVPAARLAKAGTAMLAISVAMLLLANALIIFGTVQWESMAKAGLALGALTLAFILMSGMGPTGAAVMVAIGAAMLGIAMACLIFNKVSWKAMALAGVALLGLIVAFAAFMAIVSFFAPAIIILSVFAGSIAALALALALLGAVFIVLIPLSAAAATAFAAFAAAAAVAIAVFLQTLAAEMPTIKTAFLKILKLAGEAIVEGTPIVIDAIIGVIKAITAKIPEYAKAGAELIGALIRGIATQLDEIIDAIVDLILKVIVAVAKQGPKLVKAGVDLILDLIAGFIEAEQRLIQGMVDIVVSMIHGAATIMRDSGSAIGAAITDFIQAFFDLGTDLVLGLAEGIGYGFGKAATNPLGMIKAGLEGAYNGAKSNIDSHSPSKKWMKIGHFMMDGLTIGIQDRAAAAIAAVAAVVSGQIATANEYISKFVQKLDQRSIAARAQAEGLAAAAERASEAANKTEKNKKDDKVAERLTKQAEAAATKADKLEEQAQEAKDRANRDREFAESDTLTKAKMKSEDAQTSIDNAKAAEARAAKAVAEARALGALIKSNKFTDAEEERMRKQADILRKQAARELTAANASMQEAKDNTAEALRLQRLAGAEAAAAFQKQFEDEARADAESDAFDALSDADKAVKRRADAALLEASAAENLAKAKALAYTDIEAANELAQFALDQADQARDFLKDAAGYEKAVADAAKQAADALEQAKPVEENKVTPTIDLTASDQAAIAFANLSELYDSATAASASGSKVEFNQYNTSPESLTPTEVYRQTNNLLTHAYERLGQAA